MLKLSDNIINLDSNHHKGYNIYFFSHFTQRYSLVQVMVHFEISFRLPLVFTPALQTPIGNPSLG